MKKRVLTIFALPLLALVLMGDACAVKTNPGGGGTVVTIPQTALAKTVVYNAALSEANLAFSRSVRELQTTGVLTVTQTRPLLEGSLRISTVSEKIRAITSSGTEATWNVDGPKVRGLLAETPLKLPANSNTAVDLLILTVNAALTLLLNGVSSN